MPTRVLSTEQASEAINQMLGILNGGLATSIQNLNTQGNTLSEPDVWDGNLAQTFRETIWPGCSKALGDALTQLTDLQGKLQSIHANIFEAGGNS